MIIASAVMHTGRSRVKPALSAASVLSLPVARSSLANTTIRMLFAVATPMVMIDPIMEGTLKVVPVINSIHSTPENASGSDVKMISGSIQLWKLMAMSK